MRERGKKPTVLIGRKMVRFASRAKYEAWELAAIEEGLQGIEDEVSLLSEEVFESLKRDFITSQLLLKVTRRTK